MAYLQSLKYLRRKGVTGVCVGLPFKNGIREDDERAIVIYVERKISVSEIAPGRLFPRKVAGVRVDVVERSFRALELTASPERLATLNPLGPIRPIQPGRGVKTANRDAGTIGPIVKDQQGRPCFITAAHVAFDAPGSPLYGSGPGGGTELGTLLDYEFGGGCDGALCLIKEGQSFTNIPKTLTTAPIGIGSASAKDVVWKYGAGTGSTEGVVEGSGSYLINYGPPLGTKLITCLCIQRIVGDGEISGPSDSGAMWIDKQKNIGVGLNIAGDVDTDQREYALACSLLELLRVLKATYTP